MSKLVDELLQAADAVPWESAQTSSALANLLRQRAAWVRELEAKHPLCPPLRGAGAVNQYRPCGQCAACVVAALTDPDIPAAETAPTERPAPDPDINQKWTDYVRATCDLPGAAVCFCGHCKDAHEHSLVASLPSKCRADGCVCARFRPTVYRDPSTDMCPECNGRGWHPGDCHPMETCGVCGGTGATRPPPGGKTP